MVKNVASARPICSCLKTLDLSHEVRLECRRATKPLGTFKDGVIYRTCSAYSRGLDGL